MSSDDLVAVHRSAREAAIIGLLGALFQLQPDREITRANLRKMDKGVHESLMAQFPSADQEQARETIQHAVDEVFSTVYQMLE